MLPMRQPKTKRIQESIQASMAVSPTRLTIGQKDKQLDEKKTRTAKIKPLCYIFVNLQDT